MRVMTAALPRAAYLNGRSPRAGSYQLRSRCRLRPTHRGSAPHASGIDRDDPPIYRPSPRSRRRSPSRRERREPFRRKPSPTAHSHPRRGRRALSAPRSRRLWGPVTAPRVCYDAACAPSPRPAASSSTSRALRVSDIVSDKTSVDHLLSRGTWVATGDAITAKSTARDMRGAAARDFPSWTSPVRIRSAAPTRQGVTGKPVAPSACRVTAG